MSRHTRIVPMDVTTAGTTAVNGRELEQAFQDPSLRTVIDLMTEGLVIYAPDGNIALVNAPAGRLLGIRPAEVEQLPLERLLRVSRIPLDDWIHAAERGRAEAVLTSADGTVTVDAVRRIISVAGERKGYTLLSLRARNRLTPDSKTPGTADQPMFPEALQDSLSKAVRAHQRGARVLLLGESGVGKTEIAKYIHSATGRDAATFVHVNCGCIPETLFESEMFGYERGAFTGALQAGKRGFVEAAAGGTLFLDEVGEIPLASQAKLLKFLEDGYIQPVGSTLSRHVDTRVITATNRNLGEMMKAGEFRTDLFYRIATFPITVPRLRDRPDKEQLLDRFLERINRTREPKLRLSRDCRAKILGSRLTGNLRELRSIVDYLDIVCEDVAEAAHLSPDAFEGHPLSADTPAETPSAEPSLRRQVETFEQRLIESAIQRQGSKRAAARELGIDVATLIRKQQRGEG